MSVRQIFLENTYKFELDTVVTALGHEPHYWIQLEKTIFHPESGGQPNDTGTINDILISKVQYEKGHEIKHYFDSAQDFVVGQKVSLIIDKDRRLLHARYLTAGLLIISLMKKIFPNLEIINKNYSPDIARVEFKANKIPEHQLIHKNLSKALSETINKKLPVIMEDEISDYRIITISGFPSLACSGTPIRNIYDLGKVSIRKLKTDDNILTINYNVST